MDTERVECLLCHAVHTGSLADDSNRSWKCTRCGQSWDAARVAAVMNYQRWFKAEGTAIKHRLVA